MIIMADRYWWTPCSQGNALHGFWNKVCCAGEECVYDTDTGELHVCDFASETVLRKYRVTHEELMEYAS